MTFYSFTPSTIFASLLALLLPLTTDRRRWNHHFSWNQSQINSLMIPFVLNYAQNTFRPMLIHCLAWGTNICQKINSLYFVPTYILLNWTNLFVLLILQFCFRKHTPCFIPFSPKNRTSVETIPKSIILYSILSVQLHMAVCNSTEKISCFEFRLLSQFLLKLCVYWLANSVVVLYTYYTQLQQVIFMLCVKCKATIFCSKDRSRIRFFQVDLKLFI